MAFRGLVILMISVEAEALARHLTLGQLLSIRERDRFAYPFAIDHTAGAGLGSLIPIQQVQSVVNKAIQCERDRAHEDVWNNEVYKAFITAALASSVHSSKLVIKSLCAMLKFSKSLPPRLLTMLLF